MALSNKQQRFFLRRVKVIEEQGEPVSIRIINDEHESPQKKVVFGLRCSLDPEMDKTFRKIDALEHLKIGGTVLESQCPVCQIDTEGFSQSDFITHYLSPAHCVAVRRNLSDLVGQDERFFMLHHFNMIS